MTKRQNTSGQGAVHNAKRPRKAAGFRLARPPSASTSESQPTSSATSSSLFVTVTQNEGRPGIITRSRVITRVLDSETCNDSDSETPIPLDLDPEASGTQQSTKGPKRKRHTTNYVCHSE